MDREHAHNDVGRADDAGRRCADSHHQHAAGADTEVHAPAAEAARHALRMAAQEGDSIGARIVSMARLATALHMAGQAARRADQRWAPPAEPSSADRRPDVLARIGPGDAVVMSGPRRPDPGPGAAA
jgi:hypothetical protein